jgi:hypothetical protein
MDYMNPWAHIGKTHKIFSWKINPKINQIYLGQDPYSPYKVFVEYEKG